MVDAIGEPDDAGVFRSLRAERRLDRIGRGHPVGGIGLRYERGERGARLRRRLDLGADGARRTCRGEHDDGAVAALRLRNQPVGHRHALAPMRRGGPAVVESDDDRTFALQRFVVARIEHRLRQGENNGGSGREADKQQPPRRLGRRLFTVFEAHEDAGRRELDLTRTRRHRAQRQIDHRQCAET